MSTNDNNLSQKEIFEILRKQIEHENQLIDNRTNWLLVLQGFLFISYISLITNSSATLPHKNTLIIVLCLTGVLLSLFSLLGILASFLNMDGFAKNWEKPDNDPEGAIKNIRKAFPPIIGKNRWGIINGGFGSTGTAMLLTVAWLLLLVYTR